MKLIKTMTKEEILMGSVDLVSKTYIELGQNNVEEDTIMVMAQSLADDLLKTYKNFYFEDAQNAFNLGVRSPISRERRKSRKSFTLQTRTKIIKMIGWVIVTAIIMWLIREIRE